MCSDQPLLCCICGGGFAGNAGGLQGHRFREGVCSFRCQLRKTWRASRSVLGVAWDEESESVHVAQHTSVTDEEGDFTLEEPHAKVRVL